MTPSVSDWPVRAKLTLLALSVAASGLVAYDYF